ncbi:hypothetical protein H6F46_09175 [Limnothrix sp. FACHB-1083]|uniref:hypothetical protein n=1 Tax=unclassified Limnothrix TaxID=2632864 RepID=UPI0016818CD4|nr:MULTISPECIES: hypothetical protein [unclassified Limnothrix]MBD2160865.1 hypothetical protein [Limnothrix sp. FACHB-1083]MBD2191565.1 hypothetical protein [Limnothrix sp. FACHB-1088]
MAAIDCAIPPVARLIFWEIQFNIVPDFGSPRAVGRSRHWLGAGATGQVAVVDDYP